MSPGGPGRGASDEAGWLSALRAIATDPAARGLADDAAVLDVGGRKLVLTCDLIVEGVHFRADDPPADIAWKLVAVNLSDLAAKGAEPAGLLLGYPLGEAEWDRAFLQGLGETLAAFGLPLLGGDTVGTPPGGGRTLAATAIGWSDGPVPDRAGARPGDQLWVSGSVGDAGAGLSLLEAGRDAPAFLIERYRTPRPRLEAGQRLAPRVAAMMDVSDGLLLDAGRMAAASGCAAAIALEALPMSEALLGLEGDSRGARLAAASAGDDYELLFAARRDEAPALLRLGEEIGLALTPIGGFIEGEGLSLTDRDGPVPLPARLGFEHRR